MLSPAYFQSSMMDRRCLSLPEGFSEFIRLFKQWVPNAEWKDLHLTHNNSRRNASSFSKYQPDPQAVLIPFTGGISCTALLWYAIKKGWTPWLVYIHGFNGPDATLREGVAVKRFSLETRDRSSNPLGQGNGQSRLIVLEHFPLIDIPEEWQTPFSRFHPIHMGVLYLQVLLVAFEKNCRRILWGFYDMDKEMLTALDYYGASLTHGVYPLSECPIKTYARTLEIVLSAEWESNKVHEEQEEFSATIKPVGECLPRPLLASLLLVLMLGPP